ncbi:hypothetical protein DWZ54_09745 [Mitsuokella sp. AF33-22]|nr:hypothetical protein DWZ54_09745 [Mitsuokella sp. AF33-22]
MDLFHRYAVPLLPAEYAARQDSSSVCFELRKSMDLFHRCAVPLLPAGRRLGALALRQNTSAASRAAFPAHGEGAPKGRKRSLNWRVPAQLDYKHQRAA